MSAKPKILWLEGIFDEATVGAFPATSPAVNFFHSGFVKAIEAAGCEVRLIGHAYDRLWPMGRVVVRSSDATLAPEFSGAVVGYLNIPYLRLRSQELNYMRLVKAHVATHGIPDYVFTFNDSPATPAARFLSRRFGVPWVYIAGDGVAISGANGYLIQNWDYFKSYSTDVPKIHLDGGLPMLEHHEIEGNKIPPSRVLMYMGALTAHGGAVELARAFHSLKDPHIELWITGRGSNEEIEQLASQDKRIKLYGFVAQKKLHYLASRAKVFANPRPTAFAPNKLNYPSKLLHYLAYGRPVLSTISEGLSPDYREVLFPIEDETQTGLATAIHQSLLMDDATYALWCGRVAKFNTSRTWSNQIRRLLGWMQQELKPLR